MNIETCRILNEHKIIPEETFRDGAREAVLKALDKYMRKLTGEKMAHGWRDSDLPALFRGLDAHMDRVAVRFNDPQSKEVGSAFLSISHKENA